MESKTIFAIHNGNLKKIATCKSRPWIEDVTEEEDESDDTDTSELDTSSEDLLKSDEEPESIDSKVDDNGVTEECNDKEIVIETNLDEENTERRPKRWSTVRYKKKGEKIEKVGRIKHVGRRNTKEKDHCWVESDGNIETVDFFKEVDAWSYVTKAAVEFNSEAKRENEVFFNDSSKDDKSSEAEGIFYLRRNDPVEVLAALVSPKDYGNPEIQEAMKDELKKWELFGAYEIIENDGQNVIDGRWVVNKKESHDGLKVNYKARYCLRGFKEHE